MTLQEEGQTKKHFPQSTHSSGMMEACPLWKAIDLTGQFRMHL
jgi:hypothetical protein